jgi:hypothetical protein
LVLLALLASLELHQQMAEIQLLQPLFQRVAAGAAAIKALY